MNKKTLKKLKYKSGWNGGTYTLNGKEFDFKQKSPGFVYIDYEDPRELVYDVICGSDDDMGHNYTWSRTDPGIIDGDLKPRFLSLKELLNNYKVFIEFI